MKNLDTFKFDNCDLNNSFNDYSINDSFNTTINLNYYDQRLNLKERDNGKEYEYVAYCVGLFKAKCIKSLKNCVPITCVNLHSDYRFMSDHIHINLPQKFYDDSLFENNIIKFRGIVKPYKRGNGSEDYTIMITKVLCTTNRIHGIWNNSIKLPTNINFTEKFYESCDNWFEEECSTETISEFVIRMLETIDISLCAQDNMFYPGFVTNIILSYYFLNGKLNDMCQQHYFINQLDREILIDLAKITSFIVIEINKKDNNLYLWKHMFMKLSDVCNVLQGIDKDISLKTKQNKEEYKIVNDNINNFIEKIGSENHNKVFDKLKNRHRDFGFRYPENIEEFNKKLKEDMYKMFYFKGYVKSIYDN